VTGSKRKLGGPADVSGMEISHPEKLFWLELLEHAHFDEVVPGLSRRGEQPTTSQRRSRRTHFLADQEVHQPLDLTALPGNNRHPPCAEPAAP
jgi:hypothetical protein